MVDKVECCKLIWCNRHIAFLPEHHPHVTQHGIVQVHVMQCNGDQIYQSQQYQKASWERYIHPEGSLSIVETIVHQMWCPLKRLPSIVKTNVLQTQIHYTNTPSLIPINKIILFNTTKSIRKKAYLCINRGTTWLDHVWNSSLFLQAIQSVISSLYSSRTL